MTKRKYAGNPIYKSNEKISSLILKRLFSIAFSFPQLCSFLLLYIDINVCKYFFSSVPVRNYETTASPSITPRHRRQFRFGNLLLANRRPFVSRATVLPSRFRGVTAASTTAAGENPRERCRWRENTQNVYESVVINTYESIWE